MTESVSRTRLWRRDSWIVVPARVQLTLIYAAGLVAIAIVIGIAISLAQRASVYSFAARVARADAEVVRSIVSRASTKGSISVVASGPQPLDSVAPDPASSERHMVLSPEVKEQLKVLPAYLVVPYGDSLRGFISSGHWRRSVTDDSVLLAFAQRRGAADGAVVIDLSAGRILAVALPMSDNTMGINRIVAGVPLDQLDGWPSELTTTMYVIVPLVIALATWGGWLVLGALFHRLARVRREVADITDGRSLHRRVSDDEAPPELEALIATLNAMIARLESSFMALRRFTADASHELKTPLTVLRADVERAMHHATNKGERLVALEEALHETTRMADLVESLLTLARADEGRFAIQREPVDLSVLVQEVHETAVILGEAAGVEVELAFTANATVLGDRIRLRQLFLNLVTNAIKYTPADGRVDIGLGVHPDHIAFAVRDTGIGIAAADLPHIFERFWRADRVRSRTTERGGFGLGLAISQWIAHAHGGNLTASSRLGKGSLFTVTLPVPPEGNS